MVWAVLRVVLHAAQGSLFLVTFSTMLSMLALLKVACPLAVLGGSMRPCLYLSVSSTQHEPAVHDQRCVQSLPVAVDHLDHPDNGVRGGGLPMVWPRHVVVLTNVLLFTVTLCQEISNHKVIRNILFVGLRVWEGGSRGE